MSDKVSFKPLNNLSYDLPAALVVFLVALPLCLGIALASGAPLFSGLLAGVVGGIVAGSLSGSSLSVSGPAAGLATIVYASIQELQSFPLFLTSVFLAGVIQVILGFVRAGTIGHFVPVSVIKGMLAAIGLILILKQIPHALGYDADYEGDETFLQTDNENTFSEIINAIGAISPGAMLISVLSLGVLILWASPFMKRFRWTTWVPAPLVVVGLGIGINALFTLLAPALAIQATQLVDLGNFEGFDSIGQVIQLPDFGGLADPRVYRIAVTIALVASIESLLSIEAVDKLDPFRRITPLNRELKAQGVSNLISGLVGGIPVTSVIVRSSANVMAGGRTKASAILHAVFLAVVVLSLPGLLRQIPLASLAGVLLMVGYKLNSPASYREIYRKGKDQFLPFIVTIAAVIFSDLLTGIAIGLLVSVFFVLKSNFHSAIVVSRQGDHTEILFTKDVTFVHKALLRRAFEHVTEGGTVTIDSRQSQFIDTDIRETVEDFVKSAPTKPVTVKWIANGQLS